MFGISPQYFVENHKENLYLHKTDHTFRCFKSSERIHFTIKFKLYFKYTPKIISRRKLYEVVTVPIHFSMWSIFSQDFKRSLDGDLIVNKFLFTILRT